MTRVRKSPADTAYTGTPLGHSIGILLGGFMEDALERSVVHS